MLRTLTLKIIFLHKYKYIHICTYLMGQCYRDDTFTYTRAILFIYERKKSVTRGKGARGHKESDRRRCA